MRTGNRRILTVDLLREPKDLEINTCLGIRNGNLGLGSMVSRGHIITMNIDAQTTDIRHEGPETATQT